MPRDLSIRYFLLRGKGCVALAPAVSCLGPFLQSLSLALARNPRNRFDAAAATALAAALPALTGLTSLTCHRTSYHVGSLHGIGVIKPALVGVRRLQPLDLRYNLMRAGGTAALAQVLPALIKSLTHPGTLVKLDLQGNDLGPQASQ